ncbi:immune inhibitor A, partial [candidate division WOR-3 bacterium]|nr:immune inhibitor A [candidate division WOR-3 bacterium]
TLYGNVNLFDTSDNGGVVVTARLSGYVCTDTTGESGDYMIPNLFDGLYEITASKEGYMDSILSDFNITGNHQMGFTLCPLVVLYEEDFESDNGGYTGTGDWQCGIPNSGPQVAHSGERLWATNLSGDYSNSSNSMLTTVEIDLSSVMGFPILSFYQWYHIEGYYDGGNVKISVNEGSWEILDSLSPPYNVDVAYWENTGIPGEPCYSGSQEAWKEIKKDLSAYRGNTIRIRFHFGSDGLRKYTGWYIDDITVYYGKRVSEEIPSVYSMTIDGVTIGDEFNIRYALPEKGEVVLTVYDIAGRVVRRICEIKEAGWYQTNINMQGMSSSVYFIKIKAGSFTKTKKSVFLH